MMLAGRSSTDTIIRSFRKKPKMSKNLASVDSETFRGSRYRGISKNGRNSWQVLVMVNREKKYLGAIYDELEAARVYDHISIQYQGSSAKTNNSYSKGELIDILKAKPLLMNQDWWKWSRFCIKYNTLTTGPPYIFLESSTLMDSIMTYNNNIFFKSLLSPWIQYY